jgi:hypothetical protein
MPLPRLLAATALAALLPAQHDGVTPAAKPATALDFARDVRPILTQHCYNCHGPDDGKRKGDLRLDHKADAFADRDNGAAFVAGDADGSEAMRRILSTDPEERMPPPESGDALKPAEIETLRQWLAAGAPWSEHWSFVAPSRPPLPTVTDTAWPKNDVDRFVLARLEREGKTPSPEAPREMWLRRVTFDLIGLPPTLAELDAFLKDTSKDAFEKVVDRLLADQHYGERQASDWLDVARYADSSGYQRDTARQAWKWRDWVIDAFNQNMPFDQFTIEQLAGDLLPNPTLAQRIATGFNRNHPVNTEAGEELDEYRSAYVIDRVHTTATTFLGLSVGCAQCHDHKYDPISQREFYGFYDFFNHVKEKDNGFGRNPKPAIPAPGPDDVPRLADLEKRIKTLEKRLDREDPLTDEAQAAWTASTLERVGQDVAWTTLSPTELMAKLGSRLQRLDDGSILAGGPTPARDTYELVFAPGKRTIQALRLEVMPDPSLPHGASGRADDGRFILSGLEVRLQSVADSSDPPRVVFALAQPDITQERDEDEHYLTAIEPGSLSSSIVVGEGAKGGGFRGGGGWSIAGDARKETRQALLIPIEPLVTNETSILRLTLTHGSSNKFKSLIGRFRFSSTDDTRLRTWLLPLQPSLWRTLGPFPAADVEAAFATAFAPEKDFATAQWKKKYEQPVVEAPKAEKDGKPAASGEGKGAAKAVGAGKPGEAAGGDVEEKPAPAAEPAAAAAKPANDADGDAESNMAGANEGEDDDAKPGKPKAKRLEWQEQRDWRDGQAGRLTVEGAAAASYASRKIKVETARTMLLEFDGGAAAKVWLNGTLVGEFAPTPEPKEEPKPAAKPEPEEFDEEAFLAMREGRSGKEGRKLRIGLRAGDNHLVVKLVGKGQSKPAGRGGPGGAMMPPPEAAMFAADAPGEGDGMAPPFAMMQRGGGGGLTFTATLKAEGDDLLDFETLCALRIEALAATRTPSSNPTLPTAVAASMGAVAKPTDDDETKKPKTPAEFRQRAIRRWFRTRIDVAGRVLFEELERLKAEKRTVESKLPSALVMEELKERRETHVFVRGDYRKRGEKVGPTTPAALPPMAADLPKNRLGLARWLVQKDHPLTARVTVNRLWQQIFGLGLVRTADDFGIRGMPPSHPELLDWLATEFVASGWNVKKLQRLLVLSATYRQTSIAPPEAWAADPENVLLARGPRQRLSAEMVRDQALAVSGLLIQQIGGESVKPFQPAGLWRSMLGSGEWKADPPEKANRRGLYVYWKRGVPYPSFTIFDAAKRETCAVTRTKTTTPLQALVTLNDPVQNAAGKALGKRMLADGGKDDDARLAFGFRLVTSRAPEAAELAILKSLLVDQRAHFAKDEAAAKKLLGIEEPKKTTGKRGGKPEAKPADKPESKPDGKPPAAAEATPKAEPATTPASAAATSTAPAEVANDKPATPDPKNPPAEPIAKPATPPAPPEKAAKADPPASNPANQKASEPPPSEAAAWAQIGCTLLNLEAAIRRG